MSETEKVGHTPGPWVALTSEDHGTVASFPVRAGKKAIAAVWCRFGGYRVNWESLRGGRANARLIAAAPDLIAALRNLADEICADEEHSDGTGEGDCPICNAIRVARAAIIKAEGQAQ
jgi:hypothetical protein